MIDKSTLSKADVATKTPPFETNELRKGIKRFFHETLYNDPITGEKRKVGSYTWGVYAFYDYDGEPIYVGQTKEKLSGRVGRHLTNQRTDAVAMSVLDPFEVAEIEVWPLAQFEGVNSRSGAKFKEAKAYLDALEHAMFKRLRDESKFKAVLNEKDPPSPTLEIEEPISVRGTIISDEVRELRAHPDTRLARRALIVSKLAQVISEREVKIGLRRVLVTQAKRICWLAEERFESLGGENDVEVGSEDEQDEIDSED